MHKQAWHLCKQLQCLSFEYYIPMHLKSKTISRRSLPPSPFYLSFTLAFQKSLAHGLLLTISPAPAIFLNQFQRKCLKYNLVERRLLDLHRGWNHHDHQTLDHSFFPIENKRVQVPYRLQPALGFFKLCYIFYYKDKRRHQELPPSSVSCEHDNLPTESTVLKYQSCLFWFTPSNLRCCLQLSRTLKYLKLKNVFYFYFST